MYLKVMVFSRLRLFPSQIVDVFSFLSRSERLAFDECILVEHTLSQRQTQSRQCISTYLGCLRQEIQNKRIVMEDLTYAYMTLVNESATVTSASQVDALCKANVHPESTFATSKKNLVKNIANGLKNIGVSASARYWIDRSTNIGSLGSAVTAVSTLDGYQTGMMNFNISLDLYRNRNGGLRHRWKA